MVTTAATTAMSRGRSARRRTAGFVWPAAWSTPSLSPRAQRQSRGHYAIAILHAPRRRPMRDRDASAGGARGGGEPGGQVLLVRIAAGVLDRQNRKRRLVGERQRFADWHEFRRIV